MASSHKNASLPPSMVGARGGGAVAGGPAPALTTQDPAARSPAPAASTSLSCAVDGRGGPQHLLIHPSVDPPVHPPIRPCNKLYLPSVRHRLLLRLPPWPPPALLVLDPRSSRLQQHADPSRKRGCARQRDRPLVRLLRWLGGRGGRDEEATGAGHDGAGEEEEEQELGGRR